MSESNPSAPAPTDQPPAPVSLKPPTPQHADPGVDGNNPEWLPDRLNKARETERKRIFGDVGVESADDLKAKMARLKDLETKQLSDAERTQKQIEELTTRSNQFDSLQKSFGSIVESEFSKLSEQQRGAIDAKANGDAQKRWEYMEFLKASGSPAAPVANPTPAPATTRAPGAPPPPASPQDPQSPRAIYEAKKQTDPMAAELYRQMNAAAINASTS